MPINENKLDNPAWFALTETHKNFTVDFGFTKFYNPEYAPFGGFVGENTPEKAILEYANLVNSFFIVGKKPHFSNGVKLKHELIGLQLILRNEIKLKINEKIVQLSENQLPDLLGLIKMVYPEYFKKKTFYLGNYYGIYKENQLVAVTGERMKMNDFTEVSAVITHPNYTRRGYAKQLITYATNHIFEQGRTPFLHVAETNVGAIDLYKKLGFEIRTKISFWNLIKESNNQIIN